jgi:predicted metalloprotease with PDZ domain
MSPDGPQIERVAPGSPAEQAGLAAGDILVSIDGIEVTRRFFLLQQHLADKIGQSVPILVKRDNQPKTLQIRIEAEEAAEYKLIEVPNPTPEQLNLRNGWLRVP